MAMMGAGHDDGDKRKKEKKKAGRESTPNISKGRRAGRAAPAPYPLHYPRQEQKSVQISLLYTFCTNDHTVHVATNYATRYIYVQEQKTHKQDSRPSASI